MQGFCHLQQLQGKKHVFQADFRTPRGHMKNPCKPLQKYKPLHILYLSLIGLTKKALAPAAELVDTTDCKPEPQPNQLTLF